MPNWYSLSQKGRSLTSTSPKNRKKRKKMADQERASSSNDTPVLKRANEVQEEEAGEQQDQPETLPPGANDTETASDAKSSSCQACGKPSKYRCPACDVRSCCLACVRAHKKASGCTGQRPRVTGVDTRDGLSQDVLFRGNAARAVCPGNQTRLAGDHAVNRKLYPANHTCFLLTV